MTRPEIPGRRNSDNAGGVRRNSRGGMRSSLQKISELPERGNKSRKSGLRSFMGYVLKHCRSIVNMHKKIHCSFMLV